MSETDYDVIGIGNAIADVIANTDDRFLEARGLVKGSMTLIDAGQAETLHGEMGETVSCSGGSAANTMVGLTSLGGRAAYIGKVHDDPLGGEYRDDIRRAGVRFDTPAARTGEPTGRCLILVTPDGERTMQTFLGAAAQLGPQDIDAEAIRRSATVYLEGYLWDPPPAKQAFLDAARAAHSAGRRVALSLSDSFCVERHRAELKRFVEEHVDILFANEAEIVSLYGAEDFEAAVAAVRPAVELAALTRGRAGSTIVSGDETLQVEAKPIDRVVDTTGAGDLYASGFLFGLARGSDLAESGRLGSLAAAEVISQVGARPGSRLRKLLA